MRLACVVHRFGADIAGGSEGHCRLVAERLAARHDVTILTTTAKDHVTWRNEYAAGRSELERLHVLRFPVVRQRSIRGFADISDEVFSGGASEATQERWFRENGPEAPALLEYLAEHGRDYDRILFWSFRYFHSFFGLPLVADRAVLLPTAEEDPAIRLDVLASYFAKPSGFIFLTPEEQALVALRAAGPLAPSCVIGSGLEPPAVRQAHVPLEELGIATPYVLYLGRIDPNKGCGTLLRFFIRWAERTGATVPLVMAGPANMSIPTHPLIKPLGFVEPAIREALLAQAALLVVPSPFESLSMVLLEAWNHAVPALVNGRCRVLKGQARRSGAALYYRSYDEFAQGLKTLLDRPDVARQLGRAGRAYIDATYRWPVVMETLETYLASLGPPSSTA
jgi:glycosyltransferase involved in cell wall biosynthesis